MTESTVSNQIRAHLQTPPPAGAWQRCWRAARLLFSLHPHLQRDKRELVALQEALHERIDSGRRELEQMPARLWTQHIGDVLTGLQRRFERAVGAVDTSIDESLEGLRVLQQELDALQWLTTASREEDDFATASAFADLAVLEREIQHHFQGQQTPSRLDAPVAVAASPTEERWQALDYQMQKLRNEMLQRESLHFLEETKNLLPDVESRLSLSAPTTRDRSRRTGSIPASVRREQEKIAQPKREGADTNDQLPDQCWESLLEAESLLLTIQLELTKRQAHAQGADTPLRSLQKELEQYRQRLKEQVNEQLQKMTPAQVRKWFTRQLTAMIDEIDEELATLDDQPLSEAIVNLRHLEMKMVWLRTSVFPLQQKKSDAEYDPEFAKIIQQLKRMDRRLIAEAQERKLQAKLEEKFGRKAVALSENLILFLIFLVVVFLTIEYTITLSATAKFALMIADTLICALFLAEFFTKLAYAEGKWLYVRRHFLIDLLPSIPFSLIFYLLQGPLIAGVAAARTARLARLSRLTRYIRILRPLVRIFRVLTFMMRAVDRLVRRYETVFNRNVILFPSPEERMRSNSEDIQNRIQGLRERCRKRVRMLLQRMEEQELLIHLETRSQELSNMLGAHTGESRAQGLLLAPSEVVYFDDLVEKMLTVDDIEVEELLGESFISQTNRIFRFLSAPGIRSLPGIHILARAYKELPPAALVAWMIRTMGGGLERIQRVIHWFGDLHGIVTGPQVLDRIGLAMINATMRPARRLLMFGFLFLIITLFIQAFSIGFLHTASQFLAKFLGAPIVILGAVSLLPLAMGFWFRMIAGETTDFFARISEAQFIARLKQIKRHKSPIDLRQIVERVIQPESVLLEQPPPPVEQAIGELQTQLGKQGSFQLRQLSARGSHVELPAIDAYDKDAIAFVGDSTNWSTRDRILLLYEDYLDGTPLHRSDTKTTNHLLGNITIQNIRKHRLALNLVQNFRIEQLDLSRPKLLLYFGPYLWFASITESLTHRIARLIVEYNQNCIPNHELVWLPEEEVSHYERWLTEREKRLRGEPNDAERTKKDEREFRTTDFTALHFLSAEPERDQAVYRTFGPRVASLMQEERKLLVRELFGYHAFHLMAKDVRTFNLFQSYQNHIAHGRIFFFPFKLIWWLLKGVVWGVLRIRRLVADVLRPPQDIDTELQGITSFDVAARKINRMRKPLYIECMRLRASFDVEYLGFFLPGRHSSGLEGHHYRPDLDFIGASRKELREFEELREKAEAHLSKLDTFLQEQGWKGESLKQALEAMHPELVEHHGEVLRAITAAHIADYKKVRSLLEAHDLLLALYLPAQTGEPLPEAKWTLTQRLGSTIRRAFGSFFFLRPEKEKLLFLEAMKPFLGEEGVPEEVVEETWQRYLLHRDLLAPHIKLAAKYSSRPREEAIEIFRDVMLHSSIWTEEILTLRTLQTLTQLDIQLYRELVHTIGEYEG